MPLFMPPDVPAICEPVMAPLIVSNSACLEFTRDSVRVHILSRHCLGRGEQEFRREAVLCWTVGDYMAARNFSRSLTMPAYKTAPTLERAIRTH